MSGGPGPGRGNTMIHPTLHSLFAATWLATAAVAQSWTLVATNPAAGFGLAGDLLARDAIGLVGFDEVVGRTVLPAGTAWVSLPSAVSTRLVSTLVGLAPRIYLFGGFNTSSGQLQNDIWRFDRTTNDWTLMAASNPTGPGPSPRSGCKAAALGGWPVLFFGGQDLTGYPNDTWMLIELGTAPWWLPQPTPPALNGRTRHAMATGPNSQVVLFGGDNGAPLGDTWIFGSAWTQFTGLGPPAAADCRMVYDPVRDMTVLRHPNGDTWEWNGLIWRQVPATGTPVWNDPALAFDAGAVVAVQQSAVTTDTYRYTPSPARYELILDWSCAAAGSIGLELDAYQRSLPILGQNLHLRATGIPPTSFFLGGYELTAGVPLPFGCGCTLMLAGTGTGLQFVPGTGWTRDWFLPVANNPALLAVTVDTQGIVVDGANPCFLMTTQAGRIVPGL